MIRTLLTNFLRRLTGLYVPSRKNLTADYCWNYIRFGKNVKNINDLAQEKIDDLNIRIENRISERSLEEDTVLTKIGKSQEDLYRIVEEHFKERGFITIVKNIPEINENTKYLIISWCNGGK